MGGGLFQRRGEELLLQVEFGNEIVAEGADRPGVIEGDEATGTVTAIVPAGVVRDGIEADPKDGDAEALGLTNFGTDVAKPADGGRGFGAGFGDQDRALIATVEIGEHCVERTMEGVAGRGSFAIVDPLVVPVEVDADEVEQIGGAAEIGIGVAGEHVPGLELGVGVGENGGCLFGASGIGDDADDGLGLDETGGGIHGADRAHGADAGADEVAFELRAAAGAEGKEVLNVAADPGPERDLVDGAIESGTGDAGGAAAIANESGGGLGEGGEAIDEGGGEGIEAVWDAPVTEVPENFCAGGEGGIEHGQEA